MKKVRITFEQLALLSFLKFTKLDGLDMTLLMDKISDIVEVELDDVTDDYYIMSDGTIMLSDNYVKKVYNNVDMDLYESIQLTGVYRRLNNIDILEFVLRKIKLFGEGCVLKEEIANNFSEVQINAINKLYHQGYILDYWEEDAIYDDYQAIKLTKRGELYLFLIDNREEINNFISLLIGNGYDESLLHAFLITQDLTREISEFLNLDNFLNFCSEYDRCPYVTDNKSSGYSRVLKQKKQ